MTEAPALFDATHRIAIAGATGRMGLMLIEAVNRAPDCYLSGAIAGASAEGQDAGGALGFESGIKVVSDPYLALGDADVLVDFSHPEATMANLAACRELGVGAVIGTTGFDMEQYAAIEDAARQIAIVCAPNMGIGTNITFELVFRAAQLLSIGYDIEIVEKHHRHKVDAPSGTALEMGELVARALDRDLATCGVYERKGVTGARRPSTIGFSSVRGGDVVGDHTVMFLGAGECIEITHRSSSRAAYVQGSLQAARFLTNRRPGYFNMTDVLGLRSRG
jgi:4-hydroxy-tetrahydrodipicolinate reductase